MQYDVIVIGGSYAGMAAALQLLRVRKAVLVIDAGQPRNRFATHAHGFLTQDGRDPGEIARTARTQLEAYPSLTWEDTTAVAVTGARDDFTVKTAHGNTYQGRRILFATGVIDSLPAIAGLSERWGHTVFHCPYCHGYELDMGSIGVIATGPMSIHQAQLLTEWGSVTLLTNSALELAQDARREFENRRVVVDNGRIERLDGNADVLMADGRRLVFAGIFTATRTIASTPLAKELGCAMEETPMGIQIRTDEAKQTSIPGVFACGDVARAPHSVSLVVGDGAWAGIQLHRSLLWPDP
jgi:thioredoxin reductase